ncbi:GGDEF domain-containing protein [Desulfosediminicola flagellatus]|uniref:GGDEF domain-containing protein n=1 Tax=Desulfosediminicola flagellatus TaxID=2569541 RepID=UPI00142EB74F|nr:GGDEF domain-containing protein [Desulfosediminicola flagellatus]
MRKSDHIRRWGGEEFLMILRSSNLEAAKHVAQKLKGTLEQFQFSVVGKVTASFGVTAFRAGEDFNTLLSRADKALYLAKKNGRNRVESIT